MLLRAARAFHGPAEREADALDESKPLCRKSDGEAISNIRQEAIARLCDEFNNARKPVVAPVVRVRHRIAGVVTGIVKKQLHFVRMLRWARRHQRHEIFFIHGENVVKSLEVIRLHRPCSKMGNADTVARDRNLRTGVWCIAHMPRPCTGGIDFDLMGQTGVDDDLSKPSLGRG